MQATGIWYVVYTLCSKKVMPKTYKCKYKLGIKWVQACTH